MYFFVRGGVMNVSVFWGYHLESFSCLNIEYDSVVDFEVLILRNIVQEFYQWEGFTNLDDFLVYHVMLIDGIPYRPELWCCSNVF